MASRNEELVSIIEEIRNAEIDSTDYLNAISMLAIALDIDVSHALNVVTEAKKNGEW